ncbi:MAG: ATP-binding protein [Phycisphaerales bacterium]|nr:ATP-binding protein [Phycisphaerales bacterium]
MQNVPRHELFAILSQMNPWWQGQLLRGLPTWTRAAFPELLRWLVDPPAPRAVLVTGARQVGKTTLLRQAARSLLARGIEPRQILYVTFDHPLMKISGVEGVMRVWNELNAPDPEREQHLLLDEIQYVSDWGTWLKHQVDFEKHRRIAATGSAIPIRREGQESGVGRWHTIKLPTLSFYEYLQIRNTAMPEVPRVASLTQPFAWPDAERRRVALSAEALVPHFHEYLLRGGFPQTASVDDVDTAQRLLREDIVDKVLKRDMTALFGVRRITELERLFIYLCLHDGGMLDVQALASNVGVNSRTIANYLDLFEDSNLIYRLRPFGYGKQILKGRQKVYLADAAIAGSVLMRGRALLEDATRLGHAVETAFFKHVFAHYYSVSIGFSYWIGDRGTEIDVIAEIAGRVVPFEVKYRGTIDSRDLRALAEFCAARDVNRAYIIGADPRDLSVRPLGPAPEAPQALVIPAPLACYWLSRMELERTE